MYTAGGRVTIPGLEGLPERVERVEQKVDVLSVTVDTLAVSVDARFDAVFVEQRELAIHVVDTLRGEMNARFGQVDERFAQVDARFGQVDAQFANVNSRFDRLERELHQFIDVQLQHNALTDRPLVRLESAQP
jgi:hypothetical protein